MYKKSLITFSVIINQALLISDQFDSSGIWENNCFPLIFYASKENLTHFYYVILLGLHLSSRYSKSLSICYCCLKFLVFIKFFREISHC